MKCQKRWISYCLITLFLISMAFALLSTPFMPWMEGESLLVKIASVLVGLLILLMAVMSPVGAFATTLYIHEEGLGIKLGKDRIKLIRWDNVAKASERYPSPGITTLCFRLKAYGPWLDQFSEPELRRYLARGAIIYGLLSWAYIDRKLGGNDDIRAEIAAMPLKSLQRKLAQRMFRARKEQGVDLIYPDLLCIREDLEKIEASYVEWVARHPTTFN